MTQRVFVDANIFVSRTCMDWLFFLRRENEGMFQVHTTEDVLAETLKALRRKHPRLPGEVITQRLSMMRSCVDEVLTGFSGDERFTGADEGDYHVHAGAIGGRADILLTQNEPTDFTDDPDSEQYEIMHPDDFFLLVADSNPGCMPVIIDEQNRYWTKRAVAARSETIQLDDALRRACCPQFADRVHEVAKEVALRGFPPS